MITPKEWAVSIRKGDLLFTPPSPGYQEIGNYESRKFWFYVHQPDLGVYLDITPEHAAAVNEAIWDVVSKHPYTHIKQ